ncbi:MAG: PAS domain-containing protein [Mycobacteriaceae bacterium]|nr:PAS domain-containing protein [Mycobacteriaceae bacterium]
MERRLSQKRSQSPRVALQQLPALVVLERVPVPVLAIAHSGALLFANSAFAEMVGYTSEEILTLNFHQIFHQAPTSGCLLSFVQGLADMVVELNHKDGSVVRAVMSRSAARRVDDQFALATFRDLPAQP